jgi:Ser/Thr protein kinase RdoA (MazF antagonist)
VNDAVPYEHLTPDVILTSVEDCGFECTGSILGLASYENRVYQIGVADGFVVAKFYRPGRWSTDAILEEHEFALELAEQEIPVVAPLGPIPGANSRSRRATALHGPAHARSRGDGRACRRAGARRRLVAAASRHEL